MCLAVPMQVSKVTEDGMAHCYVGEGRTKVIASTALIEEEIKPGDYIIVHAGFALRRMEAKDAEETLKLLHEIADAVKEDLNKTAITRIPAR